MQLRQNRRDFLASLSAAGAAGVLGARASLADEGPPEVTAIRLAFTTAICFAPFDVAEAFLHTEGFTDVQYVKAAGGFSAPEMIARGEVDFGVSFAGTIVYYLDAGLPITALGGLHAGCYELFAREPIRSIGDLKGRRVGIQTLSNSGTSTCRSWRSMSASTQRRTSSGSCRRPATPWSCSPPARPTPS